MKGKLLFELYRQFDSDRNNEVTSLKPFIRLYLFSCLTSVIISSILFEAAMLG